MLYMDISFAKSIKCSCFIIDLAQVATFSISLSCYDFESPQPQLLGDLQLIVQLFV